ncbi:hypothetical protein J6590_001381 [Homalodisca vitripennis]|nr:hypothetical protein J6590_001381 [Homalodisca vitripennis]
MLLRVFTIITQQVWRCGPISSATGTGLVWREASRISKGTEGMAASTGKNRSLKPNVFISNDIPALNGNESNKGVGGSLAQLHVMFDTPRFVATNRTLTLNRPSLISDKEGWLAPFLPCVY